jgi:hypothetical protein
MTCPKARVKSKLRIDWRLTIVDQENGREEECIEENNRGQADRAQYEDDLQSDPTGIETALRQLVLDDYYNPPDDPYLKECYDAGFHNR